MTFDATVDSIPSTDKGMHQLSKDSLDRKPLTIKLKKGTKEQLRSIPGWLATLRSAIDKIIADHQKLVVTTQRSNDMSQAFDDENSEDFLLCQIVEGLLELSFQSEEGKSTPVVSIGCSQCVNLIEYLIKASRELPFNNELEQSYCVQRLTDLGIDP